MLRIGSMNMMLHYVEQPDISYRDSLFEGAAGAADQYDIVLANPPFAGSLDYESTSKDLLRTVKTKKTELKACRRARRAHGCSAFGRSSTPCSPRRLRSRRASSTSVRAVSASLTLPWLIGVPAGFALAFVVFRLRGRFRRARSGWRRQVNNCLDALDLTVRLVRRPLAHGLGPAGMTLYWLGDVLCLWAVLHVFYAHSPPVAQLIVGYATGYALTRRTLPLGGAGVVEALLPFALGWLAIELAPALLAVVGYRLLNLWLPLVPALAGLPVLRALGNAPRHVQARSR